MTSLRAADRRDVGRDSVKQAADDPQALQRLCEEWQERLRLQDWRITCRYVPKEMVEQPEGGYCLGDIQWTDERKSADVRIVHPEERPTSGMLVHSVEETLVHELLHLYFSAFNEVLEGNDVLLTALEQAINLLVEALVG